MGPSFPPSISQSAAVVRRPFTLIGTVALFVFVSVCRSLSPIAVWQAYLSGRNFDNALLGLATNLFPIRIQQLVSFKRIACFTLHEIFDVLPAFQMVMPTQLAVLHFPVSDAGPPALAHLLSELTLAQSPHHTTPHHTHTSVVRHSISGNFNA